ncbi:MAG: hypothetical protein A2306_01585 [Omnitrophica WOR_2 bacterium RIFOXYB2_FULL_38_16]|nr:MAG: hypothetical protein A2243_09340 [Omnitrophica WOR_2 bacterium RIFOXYA2_FULL_38_17]OGX58278.1 MAG: hypothetical protein A2447_02425 [Omnitrophica WOR_2 bacterium RIFOXYC2_FULL_38_12]OGX60064.1 MAG: hypothetical protein A2306_01585 [Omnitrophica WOR_2 bacterium RIFOXYB2_FULL_38_16]HBG60668.1 hypothetical protein [Candidatus Omnitrophota bacterium]
MSTETLLLFIILAFVVVALPAWPYSKSWGYTPTGVLTVLLVIYLIWAIAGERPLFKRTVGDDIRDAGRDVADTIRDTVQ